MKIEIEITTVDEEKMPVLMTANAATVIRYRNVFNEELPKSINGVIKALYGDRNAEGEDEMLDVLNDVDTDTISKLGYIMHKQATNEIKDANKEDYINWLCQFSSIAFIESSVEIISLYFGQKVGTSNPKKEDAPQIES